MLAFAAGVPLAFAAPAALAGAPCADEHSHLSSGQTDHHQQQAPEKQQRHDAGACLSCCVGACVAIPDLGRSGAIAAPFTVAAVLYPEKAVALAGRSLRPDPAPTRTSAQS